MLYEVITRTGIEKSRNLMTIRLASYVGMDKVSATAKRFGVIDDMPPLLSMAGGAGETTLYKMITGRITSYNVCYTKLLRCFKSACLT